MKMKSFTLLAVSSLLSFSLAHATPSLKTIADDGDNAMNQFALADAGNGAQNQNSDQNNSDQGNGMPSSSPNDSMSNPSDQNNNSDQGSDSGSPDTATGDDDY